MNKSCIITIIAALTVLMSVLPSCSDKEKQSDMRRYADLYLYYCRKGLFDSLAIDAGKLFAERNDEMDRRLVLLSGLHSAQAAIFLDNYQSAAAELDTLAGFDDWDAYPDLMAMFNGIRASYEIKAGFDYPAALAHLTDAFNWFKEDGNALNMCNALYNISMIYFYRRDTVGIRYARQAVNIASENMDDPYMICTADVVMAMMLLVKGDYDGARRYADEAKRIADKESYTLVYPRIYMVLGEAALDDGDAAAADGLFRKGFEAARNTDPDFYFELAIPYSRMLIQTGRYQEAEEFLAGTLSMVDRNDNIRYRHVLLEQLSALKEAQGDIHSAYRYFKSAVSFRDSIMNVDKETSFNNLLDLYEKASLQNIIRKRQYDMYVTLFICVLSLLICAFFIYRYIRQIRLNKELVQRNKEYLK